MVKRILVPDVTNARAVVGAFQDALDVLINPKAIERVISDPYDHHDHQRVHPDRNRAAVGSVVVVLGGPTRKDMGRLFVHVYGEGYHGGPDDTYIPGDIAKRLSVSLKGTSLRKELMFERKNNWYTAHLLAPLQQFRDHPQGSITLR